MGEDNQRARTRPPSAEEAGRETYEAEAAKAWRSIPFTPSLTDAEIEHASALRERFRARGFELRLSPGGAVLIADTGNEKRGQPLMLTNELWEHVEAVGALLDREREQK
jgi:hypothetical protein